MSLTPNDCEDFTADDLSRVCSAAIERLEKTCGVHAKFVLIGIGKERRTLCTSPMSQLETVRYLSEATTQMVLTELKGTEHTDLYVDDANEVP